MGVTIRDISDKTGWSTRKIQRLISEHVELGIVTEERKKTILTQYQASQVCALIAQERAETVPEIAKSSQFSATPDIVTATRAQERAETVAEEMSDADEISYLKTISELYKQIGELRERTAIAEGEAKALKSQVEDLKGQRDRWDEERGGLQTALIENKHLLESAEAKAARASAQVDSLRAGVDAVANAGFFARAKMARELSARAGQMILEDGE